MIISTHYYHRLLAYITPYWKMLTLALLCMIMLVLATLALPALIMLLLDNIFINKDHELTQQILLVIIVLFGFRSVMHYASSYAINSAGGKSGLDIRLAMFSKLLTLPARHYIELTNSDLVNRFIYDLNRLILNTVNIITILVKESLIMIGLLAWMFYLSWEFLLLILIIASVLIIIMQLAKGYLIKNNQTILTTTAELTQVFLESTKNHRIIKLDGAQSIESLHLRTKAKQLHRSNMKRIIVGTMSIVLVQIFAFIFLVTAIYFVTPQILKNEISPGGVGSFVVIVLMLFIPVKRVLCINQCLQQVQQDLENIFSLLDRETEEDKGAVVIKRARGDLVFDKVSFCHDLHAESALSNITLRIKPGEIVALTGTTQSSKAVLIDLILRFLRPTSGRIMLDGHDLANLKLTGLRANVALISRNVTLFDNTVAANIAYGAMRCASEAEITSVAQSSLAVEFIREMPQGLQTMIGEQGIKLTEKQRQHIAIARAQLKDPAILVFNEIAIAAEPDDLQFAIKILMQGRASLIITNHLPTLNLADRIISV